ncbi:MAG: hypothetical protein ACIAQ0_01050 [Phycisphaerales bacterium JB058]
MNWKSRIVLGITATVGAGGASGQWNITSVEREVYVYGGVAGVVEQDSFEFSNTNNPVDFTETLGGTAEAEGAWVQVGVSQQSSLVGNTLAATTDAGSGWSVSSGTGGGFEVRSMLKYNFRIAAPTQYEFDATTYFAFAHGDGSPIDFYGTIDGQTGTTTIAGLGGFARPLSGSYSGVLEPGDYTIHARTNYDVRDYFTTSNPSPKDYRVDDVWDFQLTLVPTPSTGTLLVAGGLFASRRRR